MLLHAVQPYFSGPSLGSNQVTQYVPSVSQPMAPVMFDVTVEVLEAHSLPLIILSNI